ncbi:putative RNA-directed DNA polymerase [Tanacetum coccineum]
MISTGKVLESSDCPVPTTMVKDLREVNSQKHGGSKQVGLKQLGPCVEIRVHGVHDEKRVWFEVEMQGAQGDLATVDKIYAHESLTFNNTVACEVISKWKAGLKDEYDAPAGIWATKAFCIKIVRDQSGNTLGESQSRFYNEKLFHALVERQTVKKLKCIQTDNGGEYIGPFDAYCREHRIQHQKTPLKTPQLNGLEERMNRTLVEEVSRSAFTCRGFWNGKDVPYRHLRFFGCKASVHIPKDERSKLDVKGKPCVFLGYGQDEFGYRGKRALKNKWVYKLKTEEHTSRPRYKARLVVKGFSQKRGIDFDEIFSLVVKMGSIRVVLGLAASLDLEVEQMDVKTAFLHGDLDKEIYMEQPEGFQVKGRMAYEVWRYDITLLQYVDDMLIVGKNIRRIAQLKRDLSKFNMDKAKVVSSPLTTNFKLTNKDCPSSKKNIEKMDRVPYASAVGSLMYAMLCTRPDLPHAVGVVSRFLSNPGGAFHALDCKRCEIVYNKALVYGTTKACKVLCMLKRFLQELGFKQQRYAVLCDNQSAIHLAKNSMFHKRTKHIDIRYHWIRDAIEDDHFKCLPGIINQLQVWVSKFEDEILKLVAVLYFTELTELLRPPLSNSALDGVITMELAKGSILNEERRRMSQGSSQSDVLVTERQGRSQSRSPSNKGDFGVVRICNTELSRIAGIRDICLKFDTKKDLVDLQEFLVNRFVKSNTGSLKCTRKKESKLYMTHPKIYKSIDNAVENDDMTELWHKRLGHMSEKGMSILSKKNVLFGVHDINLKRFGMIPSKKKLVRSRDVVFEEDLTLKDVEKAERETIPQHNDDLIDLDLVPPKHFDSQFGDDIQNDEEQGADDVDAQEEPNLDGRCSILSYSLHEYVLLTDEGEPECYAEAMEDEHKKEWFEAIQKRGIDFDEVFCSGCKEWINQVILCLVELALDLRLRRRKATCVDFRKVWLKQAPRQWYKKFESVIGKQGYRKTFSDHCVFFQKFGDDDFIILLLYIDDMLIVGKNIERIAQLKRDLSKSFSMKDLGPAKQIIGIRIFRDRGAKKLHISQEQYIEKVLCRFNMDKAKVVSSPLTTNFKLTDKDCPSSKKNIEKMDRVPYASAVGSLMYAMVCTRLDLAHAVGVVSRFLSNLCKKHWEAVKWIFRYLRGTSKLGITFGNGKPMLVGFTDSDMAGNKDNMKSTSGYLMTFAGGAVSWQSRLQKCVALSTTEAEYMAATEACKELLWLKRFLQELGFKQQRYAVLCDNQSAIHLAKNSMFHKRTKHIDIRYHWIRDAIEDGMFELNKVHTDDNASDMLTKAVAREKLKVCCSIAGMANSSS